MNADPEWQGDGEAAIVAYKSLLKDYLDLRPSGIRQKLALAMGTHKSVISQGTNPNYRVPRPIQHVPAIMRICHFSGEERRRFIEAYERAHPGVSIEETSAPSTMEPTHRFLQIEIPNLNDPEREAHLADAIQEMASIMISLARTDST